ncbi:MAG TPA: hypothetical protein DIS74_09185 [Bacteroidales bacterium]|nr:hypothetical protein [Bacteroidales bacterium]
MKPCSNSKTHTLFFLIFTSLFLIPGSLVLGQDTVLQDTLSKAFYDSLKVKAEKRKLTRLLYDMVVVTPPPPGSAREKMTNTTDYEPYSGRIIRNLEIIRLNAFGSDIDNPAENSPSKAEKFMNSTYTKTRRFVLTHHLLFREGDTVSPLQLADNERLLRELPYLEDASITVLPADSNYADIAVVVREAYPVGLNIGLSDLKRGAVKLYSRNFAGLGHELEISMPYDFNEYNVPGIGIRYSMRNIARSFSDLEMEFSDGLGTSRMGGTFSRDFVTSSTKYAWSASVISTFTNEDLDTMAMPAPLRYTWQDYWGARSFMLDRNSVTRLIFTGRYTHNNVFRRPEINDFSYYRLQNYRMMTGSVAVTSQRFINTSLIYSYGRTEDIPYGYMLELLGGKERNEFKLRTYAGARLSYGNIFTRLGYLYAGAGVSTFFNQGTTEQGMVDATLRYFTPLVQAGHSKIRTFVNLYYTRGINRYEDECLYLAGNASVRGFRNDSLSGGTRIILSVEPVLFLHKPVAGFRFALFAFGEAGVLEWEGFREGGYNVVPAIGAGVRIRNDQLVLNTLQIRLAWYPYSPPYSEKSWIAADGLVRLKPPRFEPDPPGVVPFR